MKTFALLAAFLALACSPPPDDAAPPQGVEAISNSLSVTDPDGPYHGRIEIKINYARNYDDVLNRGYWTGTVSGNGTSWTNRSFAPPTIATSTYICPNIWAFLWRPDNGKEVVYREQLAPSIRQVGKGDWGDAQSGNTVTQTLSCTYTIDDVWFSRDQNITYQLQAGMDCTNLGGYAAGRSTSITTVDFHSWDLTAQDAGGGQVRYFFRQAGPGPFGAHSLWQSISYGCHASPPMPSATHLGPIVACTQIQLPGNYCIGWTTTAFDW